MNQAAEQKFPFDSTKWDREYFRNQALSAKHQALAHEYQAKACEIEGDLERAKLYYEFRGSYHKDAEGYAKMAAEKDK